MICLEALMTRQMPMWEKKIFATNRKTNEEFLWKTIIQYEFQEETNEQGIRTEIKPLNRKARRIESSVRRKRGNKK